MSSKTTAKGIVFIVENNKMMAKLAEKLLPSMYECVIFDTPENAIWQIRKGTYPAIIISSTVFPEMSVEEFTKVVSKISPRSAKVIITSKSETKDLIQLLNTSNTDFYLTKPYDNLKLL